VVQYLTHLYSPGGLDIRPFKASQGFSESAFMSTTGSLDVALDYSGVKQGKAATVLLSPRRWKHVQFSASAVTLAKLLVNPDGFSACVPPS
jgi:hypothetical protein